MLVDYLGFDAATTGTTAVEIVPGPASGTKRWVRRLTVVNLDSSAIYVTVRLNNDGTYRVIHRENVLAGEAMTPVTDVCVDDPLKSVEVVLGGTPGTEADVTAAVIDNT